MAASQSTGRPKPSGKFSVGGMAVTLLVGVAAAIGLGLVAYGLDLVLPFSIPGLVPAIMGALLGLVTVRLGSTIGRCRNIAVAWLVAVVVGVVGWGTGHVVDYLRFHALAYRDVVTAYPAAAPAAINRAIDQWLRQETGQAGFIGFMLLKASKNTMQIGGVYSGLPIPGLSLSGAGLIAFWGMELVVTVGIAWVMNEKYPDQPYCDRCHTWRKYKTPVVGTTPGAEEAIAHLAARDIPAAVAALRQHPEGDVARLEVEFCPVCYDSALARLVLVEPTGPRSWRERTAWQDKLEPEHVRTLVGLSR